ncbi:MAG: hypothetical protein ACRC42_02995 [Mycoplasma sp.]
MQYVDNKVLKYWVLEKEPIVNEYRNQVTGCYETEPMDYVDGRYIIYYGSELLRHPKLTENNLLIEATNKELIEKNICKLDDGEFLVGDIIKTKYDYPIQGKFIIPEFDYDELKWVESASDEEIKRGKLAEYVRFYSDELEFAAKAYIEFSIGILSEAQYSYVSKYISLINPYDEHGVLSFRTIGEVNRPNVFSRYNFKY